MCACLVTQSYLTLCNPMDYSLPGSSVHGDSQRPGKRQRLLTPLYLGFHYTTSSTAVDAENTRQGSQTITRLRRNLRVSRRQRERERESERESWDRLAMSAVSLGRRA